MMAGPTNRASGIPGVIQMFDADFRRQPRVALCGLDNANYRRVLDQVGFDMVIEAGLGSGYRDFRTMRLHTLPGSRPAAQIWNAAPRAEPVEDRPAYKRLLKEGTLDQCGMTLLAGKASSLGPSPPPWSCPRSCGTFMAGGCTR